MFSRALNAHRGFLQTSISYLPQTTALATQAEASSSSRIQQSPAWFDFLRSPLDQIYGSIEQEHPTGDMPHFRRDLIQKKRAQELSKRSAKRQAVDSEVRSTQSPAQKIVKLSVKRPGPKHIKQEEVEKPCLAETRKQSPKKTIVIYDSDDERQDTKRSGNADGILSSRSKSCNVAAHRNELEQSERLSQKLRSELADARQQYGQQTDVSKQEHSAAIERLTEQRDTMSKEVRTVKAQMQEMEMAKIKLRAERDSLMRQMRTESAAADLVLKDAKHELADWIETLQSERERMDVVLEAVHAGLAKERTSYHDQVTRFEASQTAQRQHIIELEVLRESLQYRITELETANESISNELSDLKTSLRRITPGRGAGVSTSTTPTDYEFPQMNHVRLATPVSGRTQRCNSTLTDDEVKSENVRKMYLMYRSKFDKLSSVARNVSLSCRGMDLTAFGDFGRYVGALEEEILEDVAASR